MSDKRERGVNRVVMAVWDFDAGKTFYEEVLGATFAPENDDGEAAAFGVRVAMAWEAGVELVSPLEGVDSAVRTHMEANGEGLMGVVFAVGDADASMAAAEKHGLSHYYFLDYSTEEIDAKCTGRFDTYKEYFVTTKAPLSGTVLLGEFDRRHSG
jgi:catechol 2,3-dioxygenase-like lactoylglutathione lyase family enzyme